MSGFEQSNAVPYEARHNVGNTFSPDVEDIGINKLEDRDLKFATQIPDEVLDILEENNVDTATSKPENVILAKFQLEDALVGKPKEEQEKALVLFDSHVANSFIDQGEKLIQNPAIDQMEGIKKLLLENSNYRFQIPQTAERVREGLEEIASSLLEAKVQRYQMIDSDISQIEHFRGELDAFPLADSQKKQELLTQVDSLLANLH